MGSQGARRESEVEAGRVSTRKWRRRSTRPDAAEPGPETVTWRARPERTWTRCRTSCEHIDRSSWARAPTSISLCHLPPPRSVVSRRPSCLGPRLLPHRPRAGQRDAQTTRRRRPACTRPEDSRILRQCARLRDSRRSSRDGALATRPGRPGMCLFAWRRGDEGSLRSIIHAWDGQLGLGGSHERGRPDRCRPPGPSWTATHPATNWISIAA